MKKIPRNEFKDLLTRRSTAELHEFLTLSTSTKRELVYLIMEFSNDRLTRACKLKGWAFTVVNDKERERGGIV